MPVNTPCADYTDNAPAWEAIEATLAGELEVKDEGETYLPRLYQQSEEDYSAYKARASFFNGTARTHEAWRGMITRKPPTIVAPADMAPFLTDATLDGQTFASYCDSVIAALCSYSRAGTLIDWSKTAARPYLTHYCAEHIINWQTVSIAGQKTLRLLVLEEHSAELDGEDEFTPESFDQWRVFTLEGLTLERGAVTVADGGPSVRMRLMRKKSDAKGDTPEDFDTLEDLQLERRGKPLAAIPFVFHSPDLEDRFRIARPALLDLALLNLAHYRDSADLRNGLHVAGTPTPWAAGFTDDDDAELLLGVSTAWTSNDPNAKCGFLEFTGNGLAAIASDMASLERQMAALGARALTPQKSDAEAFQTAALRASSETANLSAIAGSASRSLTEVLQWAIFWGSTTTKTPADIDLKDAAVTYNTNLNTGAADPATITALVAAYSSGAMSYEALFYNFQKAELFPEGRTLEEEEASRETQAPTAPPAAGV